MNRVWAAIGRAAPTYVRAGAVVAAGSLLGATGLVRMSEEAAVEEDPAVETERRLTEILERVKAMEKDLRIAPEGAINSNASQYGPDAGFPKLPDCGARRALSAEAYAAMVNAGSTRNGWTVDRALAGAANSALAAALAPTSATDSAATGLRMGDEESYDLLAPLVWSVLKDTHGVDVSTTRHVADLDAAKVTQRLSEPATAAVASLQVSFARNISGMSMPGLCSRAERRDIARVVRSALDGVEGRHTDAATISSDDAATMASRGFFQQPTAAQVVAGVVSDWPDARTVFIDATDGVAVFANGDEAVQVTAEGTNGDVPALFAQAVAMLTKVELGLEAQGKKFAVHDTLGAMTSNLDTVGSGMTVTARLRLPRLAAQDAFRRYCTRVGVAVRTLNAADGTVTISTTRTLAVPEPEVVNDFVRVLNSLVAFETDLQAGRNTRVTAQLAAQ